MMTKRQKVVLFVMWLADVFVFATLAGLLISRFIP